MPEPDRQLVDDLRRCRRGDAEAAARLYAASHRAMTLVARNHTGDNASAQDAVQEALLRVMRTPVAEVDTVRDPVPWLLAITRNVALNAARGEARRAQRERWRVVPSKGENDPDEGLQEAIAALPPERREVLILRHFLGLTWAQAGAALGITDRGAEARHRAALEELRAALGSQTNTTTERSHA